MAAFGSTFPQKVLITTAGNIESSSKDPYTQLTVPILTVPKASTRFQPDNRDLNPHTWCRRICVLYHLFTSSRTIRNQHYIPPTYENPYLLHRCCTTPHAGGRTTALSSVVNLLPDFQIHGKVPYRLGETLKRNQRQRLQHDPFHPVTTPRTVELAIQHI